MARFQGLRGSKLRAAISAEACVGVMIFGYNSAGAGGVLGFQTFNSQFPEMDTLNKYGPQQHYNSTIQGTVVALFTLLGTFGCLSCIFLGDRLGRRRIIFVSAIIQAIGAILQISSFAFAQFVVARMILGFGTGGITATISVWQSETSKAESRGAHVSAFGIYVGLGTSLALWIAFGMSYTQPSAVSWRFTLGVPIILSVLLCAFIFMLPESPRWLCKMNRIEEAREILGAIYDESPSSERVEKDITDIQASLQLSGKANLGSLFKMDRQRCFHRVILAAALQMMLQLTGVNSITFYAPTIYAKQLGFSATLASILAAASQAVIIFGSYICSFTVDRFGRRKLMLFSSAAMAVTMACLTGVVSNPLNHAALKAGVFLLYLFYFAYVLGFLGIPFLYASEIAPIHLRAAVCGIATAVSWVFNFVVAEVTPVAITDIGYKYFIVWCAINVACFPIIYFFYPETAGRSLEEIDEIFAASKTIFDPVQMARTLPKQDLSQFLHEGIKNDMTDAVHLE